ncbi:hypothetical protein F5884DRAFT_852464 [Xylogone sp. PMI_703]|nr:hypothetical protein F5884DRAFT_852464 [Xylogone sp. PMI_703]
MNFQEVDNGIPLLEQQEQGRKKAENPTQREHRRSSMTDSIFSSKPGGKLKLLQAAKKRTGALTRCLIHIPSIAISLGVLTLTFRRIFWEPPSDNTNAVLNSLQFAAQLHASLIAASLAAILLSYMHRCLSSERGVPLGFLSSNFQLHQVTYLFSSEFRSIGYRYVGIFLPFFTLAILAGPSSAITMLPRLQFWSINNLWVTKGNMDFHVYIGANETMVYPSVLTSENVPPECLGANASILSKCPSAGLRYWMQNDLFAIDQSPPQINKSVEETTPYGIPFRRYMVGQTSSVNQGDQSVYLTSTLSKFLASALVAYDTVTSQVGNQYQVFGVSDESTIQAADSSLLARYGLSLAAGGKQVTTRKPLVEVECAGYSANTTFLTLQHSSMVWPPWTTDPIASANWEVQASDYASLSSNLNSTLVNSTFIDISQFGSVAPSLAALFSTPAIISGRTNSSLFTCTIDARWMPTTAFWDSSSGTAAVYDSNPNPNAAINVDADLDGLHPYALDTISITRSFASILNVPWIDSILDPVPTNRTILDIIGQKCIDSNTYLNITSGNYIGDKFAILSCLQVALSIYIADALSRIQDSLPYYFVAEGNVKPDLETYPSNVFYVQDLFASRPGSTSMYLNETTGQMQLAQPGRQVTNISKQDFEDAARFVEMRFKTARWGYGYGFEESKLIYVGVVILLIHVLLCIVFIGWMVVAGEDGRRAWETIGELVFAAMRSGALGNRDEVYEEGGKKRWKDSYIIGDVIDQGWSNGKGEPMSYTNWYPNEADVHTTHATEIARSSLDLDEISNPNSSANGVKRRRHSHDPRKIALQNSAGIPSTNGDEAFSKPACQSALGPEHSQSDIEIIQTIGFRLRSVIFKATVTVCGKPCFLEIFKFGAESIGSDGQPGPNAAFIATLTAQERLHSITERENDRQVDFLYGLDNGDVPRKALWRQYFKNGSKSRPILQGLIMNDMTGFKPLVGSEFWSQGTGWWRIPPGEAGPKAVAEAIYEYVKFLHSIGIFYGSSEDLESIQIKRSEMSEMPVIALIDFSISKTANSPNEKLQRKFLREFSRKHRNELKWREEQVKVLSRG